MVKGKNLNIFVRFGGLNLKKQKGYSTELNGFHSPPAKRGIYAFPKVAQEFFLLGSIEKYQPDTVKDLDERYVDDYDSYLKDKKEALRRLRKEFYKDKGFIWHHLIKYVSRNEIITTNGNFWVKTTIKEWKKAFSKCCLNERYAVGDRWLKVKNINNTRGINGEFSKDHFEVFFDEKV